MVFLFVVFLEEIKLKNAEYYANFLQNRINEKRLYLEEEEALFHQDNASVYQPAIAMSKVYKLEVKLISYSQYF